MITYEDQLEAIKKATKDDPEMQKICLEIMEIEKVFQYDKETRLSMIDNLIKKSVEEDKKV